MKAEELRFIDDALFLYIQLPQYGDNTCKAQLVMTKGIFQECYKRWIEPQKGSEDMATDTRIVKELENLGKELNHINANLKCLCSIVKDLKESKSETETIDDSDFCKGCDYFCGSDDRRCIHGPACQRIVYDIYYQNHSSGNSSL